MTSAYSPKHFPAEFVHFMNTRGQRQGDVRQRPPGAADAAGDRRGRAARPARGRAREVPADQRRGASSSGTVEPPAGLTTGATVWETEDLLHGLRTRSRSTTTAGTGPGLVMPRARWVFGGIVGRPGPRCRGRHRRREGPPVRARAIPPTGRASPPDPPPGPPRGRLQHLRRPAGRDHLRRRARRHDHRRVPLTRRHRPRPPARAAAGPAARARAGPQRGGVRVDRPERPAGPLESGWHRPCNGTGCGRPALHPTTRSSMRRC